MNQNLSVHSHNEYSSFWGDISPFSNQSTSYHAKFLRVEHYINLLPTFGFHYSVVKHISEYLRYLLRRNLSKKTIDRYFISIRGLALFLKNMDIRQIEHANRDHLGAFVEYLQDAGLMPSSINCYLRDLYIFFSFLIEKDIIHPKIMRNKFWLKTPDDLPKAIDPEDIRKIISVLNVSREKALILVLLRTGMRIGELLGTKIEDVDLERRKIHIYQASKNFEGRVVYMSTDACDALRSWFHKRDPNQLYVFYGYGNGKRLSYARARLLFIKVIEKAGLINKKYTLHCLRHTFASELLNAGMRLECLQVLLGHQNIEVTRRYARLTDNTRKEEYFRAMERIERGEVNGYYRLHH